MGRALPQPEGQLQAQAPLEPVMIKPQPGPQEEFLKSSADVVFYGGAAGGGKSYAMLLEPLYQIDNPKFGAVIFRRTTKQIENEGGLWDESQGLYLTQGSKPNQNKLRHVFPSGMRVTFAHMEHEKDRFSYQGAQIPLIGFDEITHFTWKQFVYMLSRNRSVSGVPGRIRATCNPDPDSWVREFIDWWIGEDGFVIKERAGVIRWFITMGEDIIWRDTREELVEEFGEGEEDDVLPKSFTFIPSSVYDNKILLAKDPAYLANLKAMTRVERGQLLDGNWDIRPSAGDYFQRSDFEIVDAVPAGAKRVRAWDLAATKRQETAAQKEKKNGPDWTAGVRMAKVGGIYYIEHVERFREEARVVKKRMLNTAKQDSKVVKVRVPQDPGQAGKAQAKDIVAEFAGFTITTKPVTGSKEHRASPLSSQAEAGNVKIVRGPWNEAFLSEMENFPEGAFDDQVDAASDAFDELNVVKRVGTW